MNPSFPVDSFVGAGQTVAAACLLVLGAAHSGLGERLLLRPLFADPRWSCGVPRKGAESILRGAWHLTSLFWLAIAAALVGVALPLAVGAACLVTAAVILVKLRSHLAWPLFLLAGVACFDAAGLISPLVLQAALGAGAIVAAVAAIAHVVWGYVSWSGAPSSDGDEAQRRVMRVVPTGKDGAPLFNPGPLACAAVAVALTSFVGLLVWVASGAAPWWPRLALGIALSMLVLRAVGDGRHVGFSKADRRSPFARADDALYTPLVVLLAFGALAAFRLAS